LISGDTVQARLRRGLDPVTVSYALIVAGDLIGLLLCYNGIINWNSGLVFNLKAGRLIFDQLLVFRDFFAAFEHLPDNVLAYCIGISGLLWWLTLAQGLFQFKSYQREPADYLSLAASCTMLGKDDRAAAFLEAANPTTKDDYEQKGLIHAARGEFDRAEVFIKRFLNQADDVPVTDGYIMLKMVGGLIALRADQDRYYKFVAYGGDHGLSDVLLADAALTLCSSGGDPRAFADYIGQPAFSRFGLTWLFLKWMANEEREIFDAFQQSEPKDPNADRAAWLCLAALLWPARRGSDDETDQFIKHWLGPVLDEIRNVGVSLPDDPDKCALVDILYVVKRYWSKGGVELHGIDATVAEITRSLADNEVTRKLKAAWQVVAPTPSTGATPRVAPPVTIPTAATA
jgi:tetratricopeptide (TPR) repeat protein